MTKQEFLNFSICKGLKVYYSNNGIIDIQELLPMHFDCSCNLVNKSGIPICRPLSDLTKPIEHKGEVFVPIEKLSTLFVDFEYYFSESQQKDFILFSTITKGYNLMSSFNAAIKLISWHFDIAGLIEKGEAIDVNTLETNPYK